MNGIYYHCFCINDYEDRVLRTFEKIKRSGLLDQIDRIKLVCVGKPSQQIMDLPKVETILCRSNCIHEAITLNYMYHSNIYENVLYLHSKGVTRLGDKNINSWIDYMEYFCIERYQDRLRELQQYDATGVNIQYHYEFTTSLLYSGNFWWSKSSYLKTLPSIIGPSYNDPEFWIINQTTKWYCVFRSGLEGMGHYTSRYLPHHYS